MARMRNSFDGMTGTADDIDMTGIDRTGSREFRGIRFATADRLGAPVDIAGWEPGFDAVHFGPQAPQIGGVLEQLLGASDLETSEDCLFLNVFTPACDDGERPVLVWIHGGAYVTGTAAMPWYDGAPLAEKGDVVVVTINYRLGALGFLGDRNLGTLDQISALRWVRRNIARFGGDPDRVTVFGESAGGSAVLALMAAPAADDLFTAVWSMSPSMLQLRTREQGERLERTFLDLLGTDDVANSSLDDILAAQSRFPTATAGMKNFAPTEGTDAIPRVISDCVASDPRPVVIGTNRDEMLLFTAFDSSRSDWDDGDIEREFAARMGERTAEAIETYRRHRPGSSPSQLVSTMQTDQVFRRPAQRVAESRVGASARVARTEPAGIGRAASNPTWMYSFEQASTAFNGVIGACHGMDIPYAFDTLLAHGAEMFTGPGESRAAVADRFSSAIIAFAHDRQPGWPGFDRDRRATQRIGPHPEVVDDPEPDLRKLWD